MAGRGEGHYKWYIAAVLGLAHTVAIIDRFVMVLVTEPIRAAMHLSDTQLGMLQGTGFALLYCGFAIPLGAMADATSRRNLIAVGLVVWSLATMAAAFTTSFETLFATRVLVGMGEACLIPAGMSLLTAYFAPSNLARGTAIFGLGANFGYGLAFLGGGAVLAALVTTGGLVLLGATLQPWQAIFLLAGLLALPVLLMLAFVREPHRPPVAGRGPGHHVAAQHVAAQHVAAMREGLGYILAHRRSYAPFLLVGALTAVTGYAVTSWSSSLFVRIHGMAPADAGKLIGLIGVIAGPVGTLTGGWLLDRLRARGVVGAPMVILGCGCLIALSMSAAVGYAASLPLATLFFCIFMFGSTFTLPSLYVGMQMLTPDRYRGIAASFNMMIYTLAGLGLGPTAVGAISDRLSGGSGLAHAVVIVEAAMALLIVPTAFLARRAYHARSHAVVMA
ncbi:MULTISPECIES: MFS transporter [unclassified Sphingomonas]|uniref:MFS transporter n=1 Tax=unclassified Sphingomonas TaxID=196159 RepID=UPI001F24BCD5|nr:MULTISPECIES: MFS transporter [unclassified Sphingomonas]